MATAPYTALHVRVADGVATVTIDHPPLNVLDAVLMTELDRVAAAVRDDEQVRVVVVQSADPEFFLAHGDMGFSADPSSFAALQLGDETSPLNPMQRLHERWRTLPQVTIAELAGIARGGGAEFVTALDMRFAAVGRAALAQPEVLLGIIPGGGGTAYLPPLTGRARALEAVLGAELFDAELAERYGWVNRALPADALRGFVDALARRIAALPPGVAAAAVAAVDAGTGPLPEALAVADRLLGEVFAAPGAAEITVAALAAGAQTRAGERDLEGLLGGVLSARARG